MTPSKNGRASELPAERARARLSAFVYGNILVLSAVIQAAPEQVQSGSAIVLVAVTTVTTYVAHVVADLVGIGLGGAGREAGDHNHDAVARHEIRDATPILSSGGPPMMLFAAAALGWLDWLGASGVVLAGAAFMVVRLAATGFVASRLLGRSRRRTFWTGVALALTGLLVATLKVVLTH